MAPRVSVILPVHNREGLVRRAVDSVLAQSFLDFELIIVDDFSTDRTRDVLERYRNTPRVHLVFSGRNLGAGGARNLGLGVAQGTFIAFQDSDDYWMPDKLERQINALDASPNYGLCYCGALYYKDKRSYYLPDQAYQKLDGDISHQILFGNTTSTQTLVVRKDILEEVGNFDTGVEPIEDWDLMIRVAQVTQFRFLSDPLVVVYGMPDSISTVLSNAATSRVIILNKYKNLFSGKKRLLATHYYLAGRNWQKVGSPQRALSDFRRSFAEAPDAKTVVRIIQSFCQKAIVKDLN